MREERAMDKGDDNDGDINNMIDKDENNNDEKDDSPSIVRESQYDKVDGLKIPMEDDKGRWK